MFKPLRLLRAVESVSPGKDAVLEQTAKTMAYFVSTLFLASGLVQVRVRVTDCRRFVGRLGVKMALRMKLLHTSVSSFQKSRPLNVIAEAFVLW